MDKCRSYQILMSEKHIVRIINVMYGQMSVLSDFNVRETHCTTN